MMYFFFFVYILFLLQDKCLESFFLHIQKIRIIQYNFQKVTEIFQNKKPLYS